MSNVLTSSMHIELTTKQHNTRNGSIGAKSMVKLHVLFVVFTFKRKRIINTIQLLSVSSCVLFGYAKKFQEFKFLFH